MFVREIAEYLPLVDKVPLIACTATRHMAEPAHEGNSEQVAILSQISNTIIMVATDREEREKREGER